MKGDHMKRGIITSLFLIVIGLFCFGVKANAAELPSSITLEVGEKYKIKSKGTYGSTAKSIAKVSKKGVITAKKRGNCKILFVDSSNNGGGININVIDKTDSKNVIKIGKNGWELNNPVFVLEGKRIILGCITMRDLYDLISDTELYIKNCDIDSKEIYSEISYFEICKNVENREVSVCRVICYPANSKYLKDMIVYGLDGYNPQYGYWFNKMFSADKAPEYDTFDETIKKRFSGYTDDTLSIINQNENMIVKIKINGFPDTVQYDNYYNVFNPDIINAIGVFTYYYDRVDRQCKGVSFGINYQFKE